MTVKTARLLQNYVARALTSALFYACFVMHFLCVPGL